MLAFIRRMKSICLASLAFLVGVLALSRGLDALSLGQLGSAGNIKNVLGSIAQKLGISSGRTLSGVTAKVNATALAIANGGINKKNVLNDIQTLLDKWGVGVTIPPASALESELSAQLKKVGDKIAASPVDVQNKLKDLVAKLGLKN